MSSSQRRRNESGDVEAAAAHEHLLQKRLQILLQHLGWSYAALWTLNSQTRVLEWKRGHYFEMDTSTTTSEPKVLQWYAQQLYTTYRSSCSFVPGAGFVGRAYLEGRHNWLRGDLVCQNAGSLEQSQFLRNANIKTVMCIPWLDSVLELGTTNLVGENLELMDRIQQVMSHDLLSVLPPLQDDVDDAADVSGLIVGRELLQTTKNNNSSQAAAARVFNQESAQNSTNWAPLQSPDQSVAVMSTLPVPEAADAAVNRSSFQSVFDNLSDDQVWRSDIFMQAEQGNPHPDIAAANWSRAVKVGAPGVSGNYQSNILIINAEQSTVSHGLMVSQADGTQIYGSGCPDSFGSTTAATTSSSNGSSQGENNNSSSSARPASAVASSPDQLPQQYNLPAPISGFSVPDRTSSSVRLPHVGPHQLEAELAYPKQSRTATLNYHPINNLRRTTSCSDQYEIQKALSLLEAQEIQSDQWRQLQPSTSSYLQQQQQEFSLIHSWQQDVELDPASQTDLIMRGNMMHSSGTNNYKQVAKTIIPKPGLLRRHTLSAMEVLKEVETYHQDVQAVGAVDQAANSNISYELHEDFEAFDQPAHVEINTPLRFRGRSSRMSCSSNGPASVLHGSHGEAAMNHMLAERRRRVKQKENFATLRRLVPIISKADNASTLVDAITYLKDLQNTIVHMEATKEDMDQRCENLAHKCMELEEQNKELVAILSGGKLDSTSPFSHLKLQSMKSI